MRIKAELITGKDLKPGDLFSKANQLYWDNHDHYSLGEKVYIRTEAPTPPDQVDKEIYRITIET